MKVILISDVDNVGRAGDIVEVKDGYGRNYLIPQRLGVTATTGATKQIESITRARQARLVRDIEHANEIKQKIENLGPLVIKVKTADSGKLFGSVSANDIAQAIKNASGQSVYKRGIAIPGEHIKSLGTVVVAITIHPQVTALLPVEVAAL